MRFDAATKKVFITVEELCHSVVNHASIDVRGARIYPDSGKISEYMSGKYGLKYEEGVRCHKTVSRGGLFYELDGVCDGVIREGGKVCVCVNRHYGGNTHFVNSESTAEYIGIAVMNAYMIAESEMLTSIGIAVTFFHSSKDVKTIEKTLTRAELSAAFMRLVDMHRPFAALEAERVCVRLPGAKAQEFPYREMRKEQHDFMIEVLRAVKNGGKAVIEAPTGTGKTMAALFPAVKALGSGYIDKIFFFTSKTTTAFAALEAAKKLSATSGIRAVHITAKERACPIKVRDPFKCTPAKCPRANGHYKRNADALTDIVSTHKIIDSETAAEFAKKYNVCPYEFSLDLSEVCDVVICDCNYLIDEAAYFRRYFSGDTLSERYLFLFDEAHNLLERAKESFGAQLRLSEIRSFLDSAKGIKKNDVTDSLASIESYIDSMRKVCADTSEVDEDGNTYGFARLNTFDKQFYDLLTVFIKATDKYIRGSEFGYLPNGIFDILSGAKKYVSALELFDDCFTHTVTVSGSEVLTKILCLDPSKQLSKKTAKGVATVFFSATLTPLEYYADLYGARDGAKLKLDCPYDRANLAVLIMDKLSVKYQLRSLNASSVADAIYSTVSRRDGNYMVYFPSYSYMSEVQTLFKYKYPHIKTVVQSQNMTEAAKAAFLDAFKYEARTTLVGFCVLGGIYSEGIDLAGDRLIGSVIIGVGLTKPSNESEVLREYYDTKYEMGTEYAYTYPAFNRVLQAAGRVIRTETDRGVVVFIDERYAEPQYKELMPHRFRGAKFVGDNRSLEKVIDTFWESK